MKRSSLRTLALGVALGLGTLLSPVTARAQDADGEFRLGVNAFEQGRFEEAEQHFRNVLKSQPDHTQAVRYRDEAGYRFWVQVLARGGRLATVAKRMLSMAEKGAIRERQDAEALREDLRGLWADDFLTEVETIEKLIAKYGHYVVPEVVQILAERQEDEKRVRVIQLLARLGDEGTLAVIELLESDDVMLQQNSAAVLGHCRDVRAIPPLKRLAEKTQDPHVKEAAFKAIKKINGPDYPTPEYYARVSEAFYQENPLFMVNRYREYVVWKWQDGKLSRRDVPKFRWNEEVAEEFAYDGLDVAPNDQTLWMNLLNTYAQEWTEIEETLRVAQQIKDRGGEVDDDELTKMKELQTGLAKVKMLVASRGAEGVLAALGKALHDQRAPVSVFLIERLQDVALDDSWLATGEGVNYLPPAEQSQEPKREEPKPQPKKEEPKPKQEEPKPQPKKVDEGPKPTKVDDEPKKGPGDDAPPLEDGPGDGAPPLEDGDDKPKPKRRPRRVSQNPFGTVERAGELAWSMSSLPASETRVAAAPAAAAGAERVTRMGFRGAGQRQDERVKAELQKGSPTGEVMTGGKAISAALTYGDKRVRYAAAIAMAHINPAVEFANGDKVMVNLVDALGESGQRVVLVVERDRATRNRIVGLLRELGYMTFGVESGRDGLVRAKSFPSQDLILVSSELNPGGDGGEPIEIQFIDDLRKDYRTKPVKVMVLTPDERAETMKTLVDEGRALDIVTPQIDKANLGEKLKKAFGSDEDQRDEKARSDKIAERAALAIASLRRGHTKFDITQAADALAKNVRKDAGRPDAVRLACLQALAAIGAPAKAAALEILLKEFRDKDANSLEVRRAIPVAVGELIKAQEVSGDTFQVLKNALKEEDEQVWRNAGHALGKGKLTGEQAREVFQEQRLE
ncbi:MAG: HEAT repeat domain-containing protein [Planctomycetota bacterium]